MRLKNQVVQKFAQQDLPQLFDVLEALSLIRNFGAKTEVLKSVIFQNEMK